MHFTRKDNTYKKSYNMYPDQLNSIYRKIYDNTNSDYEFKNLRKNTDCQVTNTQNSNINAYTNNTNANLITNTHRSINNTSNDKKSKFDKHKKSNENQSIIENNILFNHIQENSNSDIYLKSEDLVLNEELEKKVNDLYSINKKTEKFETNFNIIESKNNNRENDYDNSQLCFNDLNSNFKVRNNTNSNEVIYKTMFSEKIKSNDNNTKNINKLNENENEYIRRNNQQTIKEKNSKEFFNKILSFNKDYNANNYYNNQNSDFKLDSEVILTNKTKSKRSLIKNLENENLMSLEEDDFNFLVQYRKKLVELEDERYTEYLYSKIVIDEICCLIFTISCKVVIFYCIIHYYININNLFKIYSFSIFIFECIKAICTAIIIRYINYFEYYFEYAVEEVYYDGALIINTWINFVCCKHNNNIKF